MQRARRSDIDFRVVAAVAATYFICAAGAFAYTRLSGHLPLLWIANAPLIAALLTRPAAERSIHIAACFVAVIAALVLFSSYATQAALFAVSTIAEALITCLVLRRLGGDAGALQSLAGFHRFLAAAGLIAPAVTGIFPAVTMAFDHDPQAHTILISWTVAHGLGALIGTPIALLVMAGGMYREPLSRPGALLRLFLLAAALVTVASVSFSQQHVPLMFLPVLPLIATTMAFRVMGAALGVLVIALVGAGFTVLDHGPVRMVQGDEGFQLQFFQFYLGVLFLIAMPFAALITQINRLMAEVSASEARYRMISDHVSDIVLTLDPGGLVQYASPSIRELTGHAPERLVGRGAETLVHGVDAERTVAFHRKVMDDPEAIHRFEFRSPVPKGGLRWFEATARAVRDAGGAVINVIAVIREVSQRKAREADLLRQATTDPMTGVLNRRAFHDRIDQLRRLSPDQPATLALFDLDHFKQVNDRFGHAAGDAALLHFTDILRANLRGEDAIGRIGGEEFAALLPGLAATEALNAVDRVRLALEAAPVRAGTAQFAVTVSAGLAPLRHDLAEEEVFRLADIALYRAKAMGRNRAELAAG